jgi:TetR/AcrR family transcriptional repressor of nem operon
MARPVEFEKDAVLTNAMEQFWREGYEASSVQKLLDATDINRGTLYNSFGDKDTFFRSCVEKYNELVKADTDGTLGNSKLNPWKAIESYFDTVIVSVPNKQRMLGCLLVNSVCESIIWDRDMQKMVKSSLNSIRRALLSRTRELEKARQLKRGIKAEMAADILMNLYSGLQVGARSGKGPKQLSDLVNFTLASIKK